MKARVKITFDGGMQAHEAGTFDACSFAVNDEGTMLCMADSKQLAQFDFTDNTWRVPGFAAFKYVRVDVVQ